MPLEAIGPMMRRALEGGYAVGYFESWNLESLQGVIDAAEETRSPVILGFNGDFLSRSTRLATERLTWYAALGRAAAESASVPCGLIFNECPRDEWVRTAIEAGFNLVMPADPEAPAEDYTRRVAEITRLAHARGVAIEAELGELPRGAADGPHMAAIRPTRRRRRVRRGDRGQPAGGQRRKCPHHDPWAGGPGPGSARRGPPPRRDSPGAARRNGYHRRLAEPGN